MAQGGAWSLPLSQVSWTSFPECESDPFLHKNKAWQPLVPLEEEQAHDLVFLGVWLAALLYQSLTGGFTQPAYRSEWHRAVALNVLVGLVCGLDQALPVPTPTPTTHQH